MNTQLNPDQVNLAPGSFHAKAASDLTGMRSRLAVLTDDGGEAAFDLPGNNDDVALYLLNDGVAQGQQVNASPLVPDEPVRVPAEGAGNPGDVLVLADVGTAEDKGKVRAIPAGAGTYFSPGIAEEAFVDGQHVKFRPFPRLVTVV